MLQWLMKGLGMTKKKLINLSKGEENINSDCQSIEEPKGWRFDWRKIIPLEPTSELIILVLLALLYGGFYYYDHYTVNKDNIYGLWQSDHHKLAISYKHIRKRGNIDWQVVQDGKYIIYAARTRPVKRLNDGTLHMELYTVEGYLTDPPPRTASAIWISIFAKIIILPMTVSPTSVSILETRLLLGKMVLPALMVNGKPL